MRNKTFLHPDYFAMLQSHGIPHCFNNWERMPPVSEQMDRPGCFTGDFTAARYLLTPGRKYEGAVKAFEPYAETRQIDTDARGSLLAMLRHSLRQRRRGYFYVNNRLEGNAPNTIKAALEELLPKHPLHDVGSDAHYSLPEGLVPERPSGLWMPTAAHAPSWTRRGQNGKCPAPTSVNRAGSRRENPRTSDAARNSEALHSARNGRKKRPPEGKTRWSALCNCSEHATANGNPWRTSPFPPGAKSPNPPCPDALRTGLSFKFRVCSRRL